MNNNFSITIVVLLVSSSLSQGATVLFDFVVNTELDGNQAAGATMTRTGSWATTTLTTVELTAPDYNVADPFDTLITLGVDTSIGSNNGLGINNPSITNSNFATDPNGGAGTDEGNDINFQESVTIEFDEDLTFNEIDFATLGGSVEFMRINVEGNPTNFDFFNGTPGDVFTDPLNGLVIPAGTDVTFTGLGGAADTNIRIDHIIVDVIPEPSTALLGLLGLALGFKRRR